MKLSGADNLCRVDSPYNVLLRQFHDDVTSHAAVSSDLRLSQMHAFMLVQFVASVAASVFASVHLLDTFAAGHINTVFNSITAFYGLYKAPFYAASSSAPQLIFAHLLLV